MIINIKINMCVKIFMLQIFMKICFSINKRTNEKILKTSDIRCDLRDSTIII